MSHSIRRLAALAISIFSMVWAGAGGSPPRAAAQSLQPTGEQPGSRTDQGRFYGGAEYLNWWFKGAPLSVPLVSSGPVETTHHGLLGPPAENGADSTVLYGAPHAPAQGGNNVQNFSSAPGAKFTAGYFLDDQRRFAVEGSGYFLSSVSAGYSAKGDAAGNPIQGIPVNNSVPYQIGPMTILPGEDSLPFSLPDDPARARSNGIITGNINIKNTLTLWGADLRGTMRLYRDDRWSLDGLAGFHHVNLSESFGLVSNIYGISGPYADQSGTVQDHFKTANRFYGAAFGLRGGVQQGPWSVQVTAQIAPGVSHQVIDVSGGFVSANFGLSNSGPEGVFAQPANEGRRTANRFAFTTDAEIKLGYDLTPNVRLTVGYEHIYYSSVVRPTDQIDRNVPKGQTFLQAAPTISTNSPAKLFKTTSFYAHGLNAGIQVRF